VALRATHSERNKVAEIATSQASLDRGMPHSFRKPFGAPWGTEPWLKWATIADVLDRLEVREGQTILDLGCGSGWTTLFLAEAGYRPTGVDLAPASIEMATTRAERWGAPASFEVADMDVLDLGREFDAVLVYDALHHTARQAQVVANVARHLRPGGWALFGEPSWLHALSPEARRTTGTSGGSSGASLCRSCAATVSVRAFAKRAGSSSRPVPMNRARVALPGSL
jgi:2-polyprenyl-3-methyl-5-hydroxy-6-metoxy-1,4-benzoquinol methylase